MTPTLGEAAQRRRVLSIDRGSSSLNVPGNDVGIDDEQLLIDGVVGAIGASNTSLQIRDHRGVPARETKRALGEAAQVYAILAGLGNLGVQIEAVGNRLVYGGLEREASARIADGLMTSLEALVKFDPLDQPGAFHHR